MARAVVALTVLAAVLSGLPAAGQAEHEIYYRYTVLGYVTDARGAPLSGLRVLLVRDKTGLAYEASTDAEGLYVIVARLGDESAGETLTVMTGTARTSVTARFDPGNRVDERGTRVDLAGGTWRERRSAFPATLARFIGPVR